MKVKIVFHSRSFMHGLLCKVLKASGMDSLPLEALAQSSLFMQESRKYILDKFQEHLHQSFEVFCERHDIKKSEDHFIAFLIDQNLIATPQLQRFTVCKEFEKMYAEKGYTKSIIVDMLANRFGISERTVWAILRRTKSNRPGVS